MLPLMKEATRKRRINFNIGLLEGYERAMRDACAQLLELSHQDDDLAVEVRRILAALDG